MDEVKKLNAYMNTLAKEIVEVTSENKENGFYKTSETNLLSLLILYVKRTTDASHFSEIIIELKRLLEKINTPDDLRGLIGSLSDKDSDVKKIWKTDAFFHTSKGWEEQEDNIRHMALLGVKKRLDC